MRLTLLALGKELDSRVALHTVLLRERLVLCCIGIEVGDNALVNHPMSNEVDGGDCNMLTLDSAAKSLATRNAMVSHAHTSKHEC